MAAFATAESSIRVALAAGFILLLGAFFRTQVLDHRSYVLQSEENRLRPIPLPAPRGIIYDRTGKIIAEIRGTAGSRRHNFGVTYRETLIDLLVHAQDIAIPLARSHPMPPEAAAAAATRIWTMRWPPPFPARRVMERFRVTATDIDWSAGQGPPVSAPISAILLLSAGRIAALPQMSGPGTAELAARLNMSADKRVTGD